MGSKVIGVPDSLRTVGRFVFGKLLPRGVAYPVLLGPLKGARFFLGALAGQGGGGTAYFSLVEPERTTAFAKNVKTNQIVFDVGANVGYYTVLFSRLVGMNGMVLSFEPVVRNLAYLYRHVLVNGLQNVMIVPAACSSSTSISYFSPNTSCAEGRLNEASLNWTKGSGDIVVPTITIDQVVGLTGISPNVIKIDVEGGELSVLQGAGHTLAKARPLVFLSTHSPELGAVCVDYLKLMNYDLEILGEIGDGGPEIVAR